MENIKENYEKKEWGGWKIVEEMLNHPDENGLYPTSECYQKLYDFVVAQKEKARQEILEMVLEEFTVAEKEVNKDELNWNFAKEIINNLTNK